MKQLLTTGFFIIAVILVSCSDVRREPGRDYMPDMRYSRAYETYAPHDNLAQLGINYTGLPVAGTIKRGELFPFSYSKDKEGDSTNYQASSQVSNPMAKLNPEQLKEAERIYLINCGICHGTALDGNGPLYNNGNGPYPAAPRNLVADAHVLGMADGQLFYSITYGKGSMGAYGPQLSTSQRWMIIQYIKSKQGHATAPAEGTTVISTGGAATTTPSADSARAKQ
jgi:mono/diheme cytochrome c family protein